MKLYNTDCIQGAIKFLDNESIDLNISDPPFGIQESTFKKHYKRDGFHIFDGYVEAPEDFYNWAVEWMTQIYRTLKINGTFYLIIGWNKLLESMQAADKVGFKILNHCIWKYNFGVNTTKKFVSSHYHILRYAKTKNVLFNTHCRFGPQEKDNNNRSLLYADLEDVFIINKEFQPGMIKNQNKLPDELIRKLILYSSNEEDTVCDFFMGNFTTAYQAHGLNRNVVGFELNRISYNYHYDKLCKLKKGYLLHTLKNVVIKTPINQGKRITIEERKRIQEDYIHQKSQLKKKKDIILNLGKKYGRGKFSIINILSDMNKLMTK